MKIGTLKSLNRDITQTDNGEFEAGGLAMTPEELSLADSAGDISWESESFRRHFFKTYFDIEDETPGDELLGCYRGDTPLTLSNGKIYLGKEKVIAPSKVLGYDSFNNITWADSSKKRIVESLAGITTTDSQPDNGFFSFDEYIAPKVAKGFYVLVCVLTLAAPVITFVAFLAGGLVGFAFLYAIVVAVGSLIANVLIRLALEFAIATIKSSEYLKALLENSNR